MAEKKYLDYEGLQELVLKIKEYVGDAGKIEFKGTVADVAHLPALTDQKVGWMYTIQAEGVTTAQFTDGAGKKIAANSEVAAVKLNGTTEVPIYSVDGGSSYVTYDLAAYTPTGTVGAATKLCDGYVATASDTDLVEGTLYVTDDNGTSFYSVSALAETFADFTKVAVEAGAAFDALTALFTGSSFVAVNTYTETITGDVMLWCLLGPVFDVADKLSFTITTMPSNPQEDDVVMYLGETTYTYDEVTPVGGENPSELGWYESDGEGGYVLSVDTEVDSGKTYYTKNEEYVQGVVYQFDGTDWQALNSGDTMVAITTSEVDALFD